MERAPTNEPLRTHRPPVAEAAEPGPMAAAALDFSPRAAAQGALNQLVHSGPAMVAQRQALRAVFGAGAPVAQFWPPKMSGHAKDRAAERGVTSGQADAAMGGNQYSDPDYPGATVYHDPGSGATVCCASDGTVTTVYKQSSPKSRWTAK